MLIQLEADSELFSIMFCQLQGKKVEIAEYRLPWVPLITIDNCIDDDPKVSY